MAYYLGIDTSNYTTSAALYSDSGEMLQKKKLLPVRSGECGLRQSDAVFHHVQQLPQIIGELMENFDGKIAAVGVSAKPRDVEGSYMPCFTVGYGTASALADVLQVPLYSFSHQCGHIAAAIFSSGNISLLKQRFLAFHVSGGTTEALLVEPDNNDIFTVTRAAGTLDLNAGQLIDRVGVMLGLDFPCGRALEALAAKCTDKIRVKPTLKGFDCCLSGIENKCAKAYSDGLSKEAVATMCLRYVEATISEMCRRLLRQYGDIPVLFAGGVMSDKLIQGALGVLFDASFAQPAFSADNAAGTAYLTYLRHTIHRGMIE